VGRGRGVGRGVGRGRGVGKGSGVGVGVGRGVGRGVGSGVGVGVGSGVGVGVGSGVGVGVIVVGATVLHIAVVGGDSGSHSVATTPVAPPERHRTSGEASILVVSAPEAQMLHNIPV